MQYFEEDTGNINDLEIKLSNSSSQNRYSQRNIESFNILTRTVEANEERDQNINPRQENHTQE